MIGKDHEIDQVRPERLQDDSEAVGVSNSAERQNAPSVQARRVQHRAVLAMESVRAELDLDDGSAGGVPTNLLNDLAALVEIGKVGPRDCNEIRPSQGGRRFPQ